MAVHISRVEIQNFRNFERLVIDPFPAAAVIVGENGVGKSNLLHASRILLDPTLPDAARMLRAEDFHEGPNGTSMAAGGEITIKLDLAGYDDDVDALATLADAAIPGALHRARLTYVYRPRAGVPFVQSPADDTTSVEVQPLSARDYEFQVYGGDDTTNDARSLRRSIGIRVLPALRDVESDLQTWRRNPLRDIIEGLPLSPDKLAAAAKTLADAMDGLSTDPSIKTLESNLVERLKLMIGAKNTIDPSLGFASADADDLVRFVRLFIDTARRRTVSDTSLGGANILYLALLLEALEQQRAANAFVATFLAVEEPEAHLHVTMQRQLFRYLLRSAPTLLLTTHSPHVAAVAPLTSYVILRSALNGTVGSTTAAASLSASERADLERYMDQTRAELLFANLVILVEGQAEVHLVPALARAFGFNLDEYGVVVANVQGTDFAPYAKLLGRSGLNVPYAVVTDGDIDAARPAQREGGLRRAIGLLDVAAVDATIQSGFNADLAFVLDEGQDGTDRGEQRRRLVKTLQSYRIYVGTRTLEVDLCSLVPDEMIAAYEELPHPGPGLEEVAAGVRSEELGVEDAEMRSKFLDRLSRLGKGRYAQRLSAHIETSDLKTAIESGRIDAQQQHILVALDAVSRYVRSEPLFLVGNPEA